MASRQSKGFNRGLPGTSDFRVDDLVDGDLAVWDSALRKWAAMPQDGLETVPDKLYFSGAERIQTQEYGAYLYGNSTDVLTQFGLKDDSGDDLANFSANASTHTYVYSYTHGNPIRLYSEDAGGTGRLLFEGDPDGAAALYYAGSDRARTHTNGLTVGLDQDVAPGSAAGQLVIDGNGYDGAIALNATAMYVGHNSASRSLILQTNNTSRITITGAGNTGFFGSAGVAKPTVSGSRGGNAALASLCTALANLGLITNSTS